MKPTLKDWIRLGLPIVLLYTASSPWTTVSGMGNVRALSLFDILGLSKELSNFGIGDKLIGAAWIFFITGLIILIGSLLLIIHAILCLDAVQKWLLSNPKTSSILRSNHSIRVSFGLSDKLFKPVLLVVGFVAVASAAFLFYSCSSAVSTLNEYTYGIASYLVTISPTKIPVIAIISGVALIACALSGFTSAVLGNSSPGSNSNGH